MKIITQPQMRSQPALVIQISPLNRFADLVDRLPSGINIYRLLEARPDLAQQLALILSLAPALAEQLARRPVLFDEIPLRCVRAYSPTAGQKSILASPYRNFNHYS